MKYIVMSPVWGGYNEAERFDSTEPVEVIVNQYGAGTTFGYEADWNEGEPAYFIYLDDDSGYRDWSFDPYGD